MRKTVDAYVENLSLHKQSKAVTLANMLFVDYALDSLHCLGIHSTNRPQRTRSTDEMPHILAEIGLKEGNPSDHSTLLKALDRFQMKIW